MELPEIDFTLMNQVMVKDSRNYFVSSENSAELAELVGSIGEEAEPIARDEVEQVIAEVRDYA